jgi:dolichol-phosphate mannosyltransferase
VGYSFLVETLFRLHRLGFIIGEVPIIYTERREGQSKMSKRVIFEAILRPWTLRMNRGFLPSKTRKSVTPPREQA